MAHSTALVAAPGAQMAHRSLVGTEHNTLADRLVPMVAYTLALVAARCLMPKLLAHRSLVGTGYSTLADRLVPMVVYTLASVAARCLMPKPSAYHSLVGTGHSTPAALVLAELEAYTSVSAAQAQDSVRFVVPQKGSGMWMYRIWNRMIGPALTRNYNLGNTLFVAPEDVHSRSRKYHRVHKVYYTAHSAFAMMKRKAVRPAALAVS